MISKLSRYKVPEADLMLKMQKTKHFFILATLAISQMCAIIYCCENVMATEPTAASEAEALMKKDDYALSAEQLKKKNYYKSLQFVAPALTEEKISSLKGYLDKPNDEIASLEIHQLVTNHREDYAEQLLKKVVELLTACPQRWAKGATNQKSVLAEFYLDTKKNVARKDHRSNRAGFDRQSRNLPASVPTKQQLRFC